MFEGRWNLSVVVLVVVVPGKSIFNCHAKLLQYAGNFVSKAGTHTNYGTKSFKLFCYFFNLRNKDGALFFDISFYFCTLTDCISNSTQPGFKACYS